MKNIFLFVFLTLFSGALLAQSEMVVKLVSPTAAQMDFIKAAKYEITAQRPGEFVDFFVSPDQYQSLANKGFSLTITQAHEQNKINLSAQKDIAGYQTYDEVVEFLQQIATDYPELCTLTDIGDSYGKIAFANGVNGYEDYQHDIWLLKISDNVNESEDEPAVYYMGAHHAREPISTEVVCGIISHLTGNYGVDDEITDMINGTEIYIVPIVNPDGHEVVLDQLNTNWRKNAADGDGNGFFNYNSGSYDGVDPNRNYGWEWGGDGSSGDQTAETYRGTAPFSEPENQAMRDLLASHHFTTGISYHSYSELVLWPYGYAQDCLAPDNTALVELGTQMAMSIPKIIGSGHYYPEQANDLYSSSGTTDDWAYGKHGVFAFTVELGQEFIPPSPQVPAIVSDNIPAAMLLLNRVNRQTLRGHVYDAATSEPVVAQIEIAGIDGLNSPRDPYKSDAEFGAYYRLLMSGTKTATFSAYGYIPQTFSDVEIVNDEATYLDVYLEKAPFGPVFGSVLDGSTGLNIEGAEITIQNTPLLPAYTNAEGYYNMDEVSYGTYNFMVSKPGYSYLISEQIISETNHIVNFVLLPSEAISFEEGEFGDDFAMSGNQPWVIDNNVSWDGDNSAASGNIGDSQSSTMTLTVNDCLAGVFSFYRKVSSEDGYDFLKFYVDGAVRDSWSGQADWAKVEFPISAGNHQFRWTYTKDSNTIGGSDKAWVDYIEVPVMAITLVNAGPDQIICKDETASLNAFAMNYTGLQWTTSGDGVFSDATSPASSYTPGTNDIATGTATLTIEAQGTQTATDAMTLTIDACLGAQFLENKPVFTLLPNPSTGMFSLELNSAGIEKIEIFSVSGQLIYSQVTESATKNFTIDGTSWEKGIYLVKITGTEGSFSTERMLIQ